MLTKRDQRSALLLVVVLMTMTVVVLAQLRPLLFSAPRPWHYLIWGTQKPTPGDDPKVDPHRQYTQYFDPALGGPRAVMLYPWMMKGLLREQIFPTDTVGIDFENEVGACSETCYSNACGTNPGPGEPRWNGKDLAPLIKLKQLRRLRVSNVWLGKQALNTIANCQNLELLSLDRCDFDDQELPELTRLKNLRTLRFYDSYYYRYVSKRQWIKPDWLMDMPALRELQLVGVSNSTVIQMSRLVPDGCKVALADAQYTRLINDPKTPSLVKVRLITRTLEEMQVYTGY